MSALSFKKQFAQEVASGRKCQTIRALRNRPIKQGEKLYLYTGMRTKGCRKLKETVCKRVRHVRIFEGMDPNTYVISVDGKLASDIECVRLAVADGFVSVNGLIDFFREQHGLPFEGHVINW